MSKPPPFFHYPFSPRSSLPILHFLPHGRTWKSKGGGGFSGFPEEMCCVLSCVLWLASYCFSLEPPKLHWYQIHTCTSLKLKSSPQYITFCVTIAAIFRYAVKVTPFSLPLFLDGYSHGDTLEMRKGGGKNLRSHAFMRDGTLGVGLVGERIIMIERNLF